MSRLDEFIMKPVVYWIMMVLGLPFFSSGLGFVKDCMANPDPNYWMVALGYGVALIGCMMCWSVVNAFKSRADSLQNENNRLSYERDEYRSLARRSGFRGNVAPRASNNSWIDDDDIDGDGRGGDTLRRLGVIE